MSRKPTPVELGEARRALAGALVAAPACRDALASPSVGGRIETMLKVATLAAWRTPEQALAAGRGAIHLAQRDDVVREQRAAWTKLPRAERDAQWLAWADFALGGVFSQGSVAPDTFNTPQQRVQVFLATLLQIAGEYLVMTRPARASIELRRAVRVVARELADDERLFPLQTATAMDPQRYWPELLGAAWQLGAAEPQKGGG